MFISQSSFLLLHETYQLTFLEGFRPLDRSHSSDYAADLMVVEFGSALRQDMFSHEIKTSKMLSYTAHHD